MICMYFSDRLFLRLQKQTPSFDATEQTEKADLLVCFIERFCSVTLRSTHIKAISITIAAIDFEITLTNVYIRPVNNAGDGTQYKPDILPFF